MWVLEKQIAAIRKTGHVHRNWYLETYPDVARLGMEPAEHYLKYGAIMGRNPGTSFDTKLYLERYPDVAETGMNPLLHYARFGKKEGRDIGGGRFEKAAARLTHYLWAGGPQEIIIPQLEEIASNPKAPEKCRFDAARKLAIRLAFDGDTERALHHMHRLPDIAPGLVLDKSYLVTLAFLYLQVNDRPTARTSLKKLLMTSSGEKDPDAILALANTFEDDADRLSALNQVYVNAGLTPLRLRDPGRPLALDNIESTVAPTCTADHGLVSVIMPIYKAEDVIEIAIRSLLQQSYRNIEIVAVDDCSPDETFAVLTRLAAEDPRVRPFRQSVNAGAYPARNRGLEEARGDFITTHDADDWSHPQKIETQLAALVQGDAKGVVAHWIRVTPQLQITTNWRLTSEVLHWSHSTFLASRTLFDELGPWDNVRISADTELIWRMQAAYGWHSLTKIMPDAPLALALDDDSSLTRTKQTHVSTIYYGLRRFYREIAQHWHRQPGGPTAENNARRLDMIPEEMFRKIEGTVTLDLVLRGDCTSHSVVEIMHRTLRAPGRAGQSIGIDHRPDITRMPGRFAQAFFDLLARPGVRPVIPGTAIRALEEIDVNG
ncbi:MAG: glycosyltransferase family 2 protein [Pseudomonadota bacterium]